MKAAVIGSGVSGLVAGATLAQAGYEVAVFEQFNRPGGVTAPFEKDGFRWDLGQLVIEGMGKDEPVGEVLDALGLLNQIAVKQDERGYVFPDFNLKKPETYQGVQWRLNRLKELFPQDAEGIDRYWKDHLRLMNVMTLGRKMEKAQGLAKTWLTLRLYARLLPLLRKKDWSAQQLMDDYFTDDRLKCVFISILADFFTPPSKFLGLGVFAINQEITFDLRIPKTLAKDTEQMPFYSVLGGIGEMVNALVWRIEALGGKVLTNTAVKKIVVENGRATGVETDAGEVFPADVVVASGGAKELFLDLIGEDHLPPGFKQDLLGMPLMDSVFMVHMGLDYDPSPYLHGVCTYFYGTYDIEKGIKEIEEGLYHEGRDGFVVHLPTTHSPGMAPDGHHAMTIYTICPDTLREGSWEEKREEYADALIGYAEKHIPGLKAHIRTSYALTPDDFRKRTHTHHHAFGGLAPYKDAWKAAHRTPVEGLWFVGAQSESGGGVNNVIPAAYKTALRIIQESR